MSDREIELFQIDAFTDRAFAGNPAAVCLLDSEAPDCWMQDFAAEMNLSETAFVFEAEEAWRLRWFTPITEVRLCGHATLAAAHALWESGGIEGGTTDVCFRTRAGDLTVSRTDGGSRYVMSLPRIDVEPVETIDSVLRSKLGGDRIYRTVGPGDPDLLVELGSSDEVVRYRPDLASLEVERVGLIVTARSDEDIDFVSRYFAPHWGIPEDPVTGSAHAALFPFWIERLARQPLRARQLSERGGLLTGELDEASVRIRGEAVTVFRGRVSREATPE